MIRVQWIAVALLGVALFASSTQAGMLTHDGAHASHALLSLSTAPSDIAVPTNVSQFELAGLEVQASPMELAAIDLTLPAEGLASNSLMTSNHAGGGLSPISLLLAASATAITPEPGTMVLMAFGALGVALAARRRRK